MDKPRPNLFISLNDVSQARLKLEAKQKELIDHLRSHDPSKSNISLAIHDKLLAEVEKLHADFVRVCAAFEAKKKHEIEVFLHYKRNPRRSHYTTYH